MCQWVDLNNEEIYHAKDLLLFVKTIIDDNNDNIDDFGIEKGNETLPMINTIWIVTFDSAII